MKKISLMKKAAIKHKHIIGTRWDGLGKMFRDRLKMEFIDKTNCIYTSMPDRYPMTYKLMKDKIFVNEIQEPFEIRGNILFNGEIPVFKKAA